MPKLNPVDADDTAGAPNMEDEFVVAGAAVVFTAPNILPAVDADAIKRGTSVANLNFKFHKSNMDQLLE